MHRRIRGAARIIGALALCVLVAPGTWVRSNPPPERIHEVMFTPVTAAAHPDGSTNLAVDGLWALDNRDPFFGGYSALVAQPGGRAIAFSDLGETLAFTLPGRGASETRLKAVRAHPQQGNARQDIESATADPRTGRIWVGYEQHHAIRRWAPGDAEGDIEWPEPMQGWDGNSGAEALVRLDDGRFLAFGERNARGLLFAGDPVDSADPLEFTIGWPDGHHPVDAAQLPDGRVLVLTRKIALAWPAFESLLLVGNPRTIRAGETWEPRLFARLDTLLPRENYEALAVEREGAGVALWLMSDDNFSSFQRTLLARLHLRP